MNEQTELLRAIRDLLEVIAEPALAKRDEKLRTALREVAGRSPRNVKAIKLMDGSRTQAAIVKEGGIDQASTSRLIKKLRDAGLLHKESEAPKLVISIPPNFFDGAGD